MELMPPLAKPDHSPNPTAWEKVLLDSVAKRGSGHTPSKRRSEYWGGRIKWISLADSQALDRLFIESTVATITPQGIANSSAVLYPPGTVVLSRDAGVGKSAIMKCEMAVSQHFMAWVCGHALDNCYLYYWLQSKKPEFERIANGSTIKTIGLAYFRDLKIVLPPIEEQRAIAAALSDIDALLAGLERLIAKKRDIKQATMEQLLTGQTRLPGFSGEWVVKTIDGLATVTKGSQLQSGEINGEGQFPHLNGGISASSYTNKANTSANTIAISEGGNSCGYVQFISCPYWCGGHCYSVISRKIDNLFLYQALKAQQTAIMGLRVGSGLPNVQKTALCGFRLSLPSELCEQIAIAKVLTDMDNDLSTLDSLLDKTRAIKQGMMQELLTGRTRLI